MKEQTQNLIITLVWTLLSFSGSFSAENTRSNRSDLASLKASGSTQDTIVISSLQAAEKLVVQANTDIANGRLDIKMMAERRRAATSALLPQVTAGGSATDNTNIPTTIIPGGLLPTYPNQTPIALGVQYGANGTIQAQQKLFDASSIIGLKAASASERLSGVSLEKIKEEVALQVATVYYNLQLSSRQIDFLKKQVESYQSLSQVAEVQFQAGVARKSDKDRIKVNQTNIETELDQLENLYSRQLSDLADLLGLHPQQILLVRDETVLDTVPRAGEGAFDVRLRPDWQVLEDQAELQELDIRLKKAAWLPVLAANGNYNQDFYGAEFNLQNKNGWYPASSISLTLDVPIFDGFKRSAELAQSRLDLEKTRNLQTHLLSTVNKEILDAESSLAFNNVRLADQKANQDLANEVYEETVVEYKGGTATLADLLNAENALLESQAQYMAALADKLLAELSLNKAKGTLLSSLQLK